MSSTGDDIADLRRRLEEAEQTSKALLGRDVDAVVTESGTSPIMLRASQEALRASERRFSAVFAATSDAMMLFDDAGRYIDANEAACLLLDTPRDEILRYSVGHFIAQPSRAVRTLKELAEGGVGEAEIVVSGRERTVEYRTVGNIVPGLHLLVFCDVTEARAALAAQARLAATVASSDDAIVGVASDGRITDWNNAAERLYGYRTAEVLGRTPEFLEPPTEMAAGERLWRRVLSGEQISGLESRRLRKDGTLIDVSLTMSPIRNLAGSVIGGSKIARDISERKAAEQRFAAVLEAAPDAIIAVKRGIIVMANRQAQTSFGYARDELLGQSIQVLVPDELRTKHAEHEAAYVESPAPRPLKKGRELKARRKDGSTFDAEIVLTPLEHPPDGLLIIASLRDVSERNRMREQLMVADRMVSIGTLAAGVAHEINNPLAAVIANLDFALGEMSGLAKRVDGLGELTDELRDARAAAERVRDIVRDLKIFSRSEEDRLHAVDVRSVMESTLRMAWNEIRHRARLVKDYGDVPRVRASDARLGQVFLNIVVNAAQAIEEGRAEANEIRITTSLDASGDVVVSISDTGAGMPPEILSRLFTPFFTTKPIGVGTGLGLSICQRLVMSFGGRISVQSQPGKGTVFRIFLSQALPEEAIDAIPVAAPSAARRGRVLVVDDEQSIGHVVRRALGHEHAVTALTSAREALEQIEAGERFDVILCDIMMPQMTGMELYAAILKAAPEQAARILFLTGGTFTPSARAFVHQTTNLWIEKPFDVRQLRALVNDKMRQ